MFDMMMMYGATINEMLEVCEVSPEELYEDFDETDPEIDSYLLWCQNGAELANTLETIKRMFPSAYIKRELKEMDTCTLFIQSLDCDTLEIRNLLYPYSLDID